MHKNFIIFTYADYANCGDAQILPLIMVKDTDVVKIALLKTTSMCTFVENKSHKSTSMIFLHFPIVYSW